MLKSFVLALGVVTPYHIPTLLDSLPFWEMLVVKVVIPNCRAAISKFSLPKRQSLITYAAGTLLRLHEQGKEVWLRRRLLLRPGIFLLDEQLGPRSLLAVFPLSHKNTIRSVASILPRKI